MGGKAKNAKTDEFTQAILDSNQRMMNQRAAKAALQNIENYETVKGNIKQKKEGVPSQSAKSSLKSSKDATDKGKKKKQDPKRPVKGKNSQVGTLESASSSDDDEEAKKLKKKQFKHADNSIDDEDNSDIDGSRIIVEKDYGYATPSDTMSDSNDSVVKGLSLKSRNGNEDDNDKGIQTKKPKSPKKKKPKFNFNEEFAYNIGGQEAAFIEWEFEDPQGVFSTNNRILIGEREQSQAIQEL